jgi:hypothetical protein
MYATALGTVFAAKASGKWLDYIPSSDVTALNVACKIEREMNSFRPGPPQYVAEVYMKRVRDAVRMMKDPKWLQKWFEAEINVSRIVSPGWGRAGGF